MRRCLHSDKWVRYPVWQHTFVSPSAFSRRAVVSYWRKYVHEVLVNRLGGLSLPRKSVVRLTDRPDMTLDVYRGRKTKIQQQQHSDKIHKNKINFYRAGMRYRQSYVIDNFLDVTRVSPRDYAIHQFDLSSCSLKLCL